MSWGKSAGHWFAVGIVSGPIIRGFAPYNFCRYHRTLRVTPAMEAGLTTELWSLNDPLETVL